MKNGIPWLKLTAEGVLIVLSILAAFGIDAWWAGRREARDLRTALAALTAGLEESRPSVEVHQSRVSVLAEALERFIVMEPGETLEAPADSIGSVPGGPTFGGYGRYVAAIHLPMTQDDNIAFLRGALEEPVIERLPHAGLQAAIVRWRETVNQLDELDRMLAEHWTEALRALGADEDVGRWVAGQRPDVDAADIRRLRADPAVYAIAVRKAVLMRLQVRFLGELAGAESDLLAAIDDVQEGLR